MAALASFALEYLAWVDTRAVYAGQSVGAFIARAWIRTAAGYTEGEAGAFSVFVKLTVTVIVETVAGLLGHLTALTARVAQVFIDASITVVIEGVT